jgi:hypothetical protein
MRNKLAGARIEIHRVLRAARDVVDELSVAAPKIEHTGVGCHEALEEVACKNAPDLVSICGLRIESTAILTFEFTPDLAHSTAQ